MKEYETNWLLVIEKAAEKGAKRVEKHGRNRSTNDDNDEFSVPTMPHSSIVSSQVLSISELSALSKIFTEVLAQTKIVTLLGLYPMVKKRLHFHGVCFAMLRFSKTTR
jgi:hypothetical protein